MNFIDTYLNRITMYRLVLYCLIAFVAIAVALSSVRILPYDPVMLVLSTLFLVVACDFFNGYLQKYGKCPQT